MVIMPRGWIFLATKRDPTGCGGRLYAGDYTVFIYDFDSNERSASSAFPCRHYGQVGDAIVEGDSTTALETGRQLQPEIQKDQSTFSRHLA